MNQIEAERKEWVTFLSTRIFKGRCPVCFKGLNRFHAIAHVGSCNFNGPNLSNGFLRQVKNGEWPQVVEPFTRLTSMDMMACEVLRCPDAMAVSVWVEVDLAIAGDQYLAYVERIDEYALSQIERATSLHWTRF